MNDDIISIILKFVNYKTLMNFKLVNKSCKYLAELEIQRRYQINPTLKTSISKDYIDINHLLKLIKTEYCIKTQLRWLSILYILYNKSFQPFDWYMYNLPMKLLYIATNDEFNTVFNHWLIQEFFRDLPGLWSREETFMDWYDKMEQDRQLFLKRYVLTLYKCPEEYIYIITRTPPLLNFDELEFIQIN